jgi:hypothetical protein
MLRLASLNSQPDLSRFPGSSTQPIHKDSLSAASLVVLGGLREMFTHEEVQALKDFLGAGGVCWCV